MEIQNDYLEIIRRRRVEKGLPRCERDEQLELFLARLNAARVSDGLPQLTPGRIAKVLEGIPTSELYPFYKQCEGARHFSRFFWWITKARNREGRLGGASLPTIEL